MLFEWDYVNRYTADEIGGTSFPWAPWGSSETITKMLFDPNDINPNPADLSGQTPFLWAAENGCAGVAQLVEGPYDLIAVSAHEGGFPELFTAEPPEMPEPLFKRIRWI